MKYYSEKLEKLFDTVDELQTAEATEKTKEEKIAALTHQIEICKGIIEKNREKVIELTRELCELQGGPKGATFSDLAKFPVFFWEVDKIQVGTILITPTEKVDK